MEQLHRDILRRHSQASAAALLFSVLFSISYLFDLTALALHELVFLLMSYWCVHGFLLYLVISGRSKRYKDPSLIIPFMLAGISFITLMLINSDVLRPVWIMAYLAVMPFGVYRLSWKEYLCICLFVLACYSGVLSYFHAYELSVWSLEMELLAGLAFLACIMAYTVIGKEFSILREAYRQKNRELRHALVKIEELAITDELTGLFNRRYLVQMLEKQQALSNREGLPFVLAFIDIDHFKQINDIHGHRVGDQVLTELSWLLSNAIREVDVAARYGGEEFVLLLSGINLDAGRTALERIRIQVTEQRYSDEKIPLTVSVGIVEHHHNENVEAMLNRADRLLYEAKRGGRNRVKAEPQELSLFGKEAL